MRSPRLCVGWLAALFVVLCASNAPAQPTSPHPPASASAASLPLNELPPKVRARVRKIVEQPTISVRAPAEEFDGQAAMYRWLLDHPDCASAGWRRLGTPCLEITARGNGCFGWADDQGSDLHWEIIHDTACQRIWYAEGKARPGALLPPMAVYAVVVLHHEDVSTDPDRPRLRQQADLFLYTDSKTAALMARLMGPSAPRMAEQCAVQLQYFFSALTSYLGRHPERAHAVLFGSPGMDRTPAVSRAAMTNDRRP
jgi:hypothetical protein